MNSKAVSRIGWILGRMRREAAKRHAPVLTAEKATAATPFSILVFTMLSARTKDETTMKAVGRLFRIAETPKQITALGQKRLEKILYGVGFYRVKAKNLLRICAILQKNGNRVPSTIESLLLLPGVGRKTANIVLARAFNRNTLGVDVHVHRMSNRLGLVKTKKPEETERALVRIIPQRHIRTLNRDFVAFGQTVCLPRNPRCAECPIRILCPRIGVK